MHDQVQVQVAAQGVGQLVLGVASGQDPSAEGVDVHAQFCRVLAEVLYDVEDLGGVVVHRLPFLVLQPQVLLAFLEDLETLGDVPLADLIGEAESGLHR